MENAESILRDVLALLEQGFSGINSLQGLVIAIVAALLMKRFGQIWIYTALATLTHEAVNIARRILADDPTPLPNFADVDGDLKRIGIRLVGYFVAIAVAFLIKRLLKRAR